MKPPPYAYIPGHGLPHPVNDPRGHLYSTPHHPRDALIDPDVLSQLPTDPVVRRRALVAVLVGNPEWQDAIDLFNGGFYWESHEAWEGFWNTLGRTTSEARLVQGLIHLAAACVKIREGNAHGVARHTHRARELLDGELTRDRSGGVLGVTAESIEAVVAELVAYKPACWHTAFAPVVRVLDATLSHRIAAAVVAEDVQQA